MKVLVVDDSQLNLAIAKRYLEPIPDITQIVLCNNPTKAKNLLEEEGIDILILDIIMPGITGYDIIAALRSDPKYDDLLIIMLISLEDMDSYQRCFELGVFDYINKPINAMEFTARLKVAIEWKNNSNHLKSLINVITKQNEELKEMNAKLTEAKFSLVQSEKMAAIGQLAAGIAHEINNPMGFVNSNFDVLKKYFTRIIEFINYVNTKFNSKNFFENQVLAECAAEVEGKFKSLKLDLIMDELDGIFIDSSAGIQRVTEIVQSLRIYARTSADGEKDTLALHSLIQQVLLITKNELKFITQVQLDVPEDIILYCNRIQLGQVFVNIILNAAQAIKSQNREDMGTIKISAEVFDQEIIINFQDDGPGIPEENLSKIFEPFFTTKEIGKGTGLGLSVSYDIVVNKHNGAFEVSSELGKGATFTVILPIITL
ncbi:MAG: ATP-binding protein [Herbinix sp.]|jgi:signal transduction histidine kinase|nr:ATP-binding protein [Herbinix sp.]